MKEKNRILDEKIKASTAITLRCKETGLDKKIEFAHQIYDDPVILPSKGTIINYKDRDSKLSGTYKVKKPYWNLEIAFDNVVRLNYGLELKKIK